MSFLFGLFRFLTWGNIIVAGFFLLFVLMSLVMVPSLLGILMPVFFLGTVLYHNILCTQLQRTIMSPEVPLPATLPRTILVTGIVAFIYAVLVAINMIFFAKTPDEELMKMMNMDSIKNTEGLTKEELVRIFRKMALVLGSIHAIAIAVNCELSRIFFNRWRKDQQPEEETTRFDINNPNNP